MDLNKFFNESDARKAEKIIVPFHDKILLDNKINNTIGVLLSIYMTCNENKKSMMEKTKAKEIFVQMGRSSSDFDKALYEISGKRKGKTSLVNIEKNHVGLNFEGLKKIKELLK